MNRCTEIRLCLQNPGETNNSKQVFELGFGVSVGESCTACARLQLGGIWLGYCSFKVTQTDCVAVWLVMWFSMFQGHCVVWKNKIKARRWCQKKCNLSSHCSTCYLTTPQWKGLRTLITKQHIHSLGFTPLQERSARRKVHVNCANRIMYNANVLLSMCLLHTVSQAVNPCLWFLYCLFLDLTAQFTHFSHFVNLHTARCMSYFTSTKPSRETWTHWPSLWQPFNLFLTPSWEYSRIWRVIWATLGPF